MRKNWKQWIAMCSVAALVFQSAGMAVRADEAEDNGDVAVAAEQEAEETELKPAENLRWTENGKLCFHNPNSDLSEDAELIFNVQIYRDGEETGKWKTGEYYRYGYYGEHILDTDEHNIYDSGTYTFKMQTLPYSDEEDVNWDWDFSKGAVSEMSPEFVYVRPDVEIGLAENIVCDSTGKVTWDPVEHAQYYTAYLYRADETEWDGYAWVNGITVKEPGVSFKDNIAQGYEYAIRIVVYSEDITKYANRRDLEFAYIPVEFKSTADAVNGKLDNILDAAQEDADVTTAVASVKDAFSGTDDKSELQIAMQADSQTQEKIKNLEEQYKEAMNLETAANVSEDTGIDGSSISLLGAALNATEAGKVTLNISKADEEVQKEFSHSHSDKYQNVIVLDLELEGAGISKGEALAIPVTVTMAAPAGMDVNRLTILHYNENGTYETLPVRLNADGTISFTVLHFSKFFRLESLMGQTKKQPRLCSNCPFVCAICDLT